MHLRIVDHLVRLSLGDLAAEVEHDHPVRDVHDHADVVLDHDHRHPPLLVEVEDVAGHVLLLFQVHPGHRLVEQDQLRLQGDGAGQLDALAQAVRQRAGHRLADVRNLQEVDDLLDLAAVRQLFLLRAAEPVERAGEEVVPQQVVPADHDVVEHRHVIEQRQVLERPADAERRARRSSSGG